MKRLTNDNPQDNVSSALNLFYVKDKSAWVRGGGPGPKYEDISLDNYVRMIAKEHDLDIAQSENEDEISCEMAELLFDGTSTVEGIVATLYTAGWAFAELRERLKHYEEMKAQDRSNDPLTLEELREMAQSCEGIYVAHTDGSPVFREHTCCAAVLDFRPAFGSLSMHIQAIYGDRLTLWEDEYGKTWLAYRRKPEEVRHDG